MEKVMVVEDGLLSADPTDFQEANGCSQLDGDKSGRVSVAVCLPVGQDSNAQALPVECGCGEAV